MQTPVKLDKVIVSLLSFSQSFSSKTTTLSKWFKRVEFISSVCSFAVSAVSVCSVVQQPDVIDPELPVYERDQDMPLYVVENLCCYFKQIIV